MERGESRGNISRRSHFTQLLRTASFGSWKLWSWELTWCLKIDTLPKSCARLRLWFRDHG